MFNLILNRSSIYRNTRNSSLIKHYLLDFNLLKKVALLLFLIVSQSNFGQNLSLQITSKLHKEQKVIDSMGYQTKHTIAKNILDEVERFSNLLIQTGYLESTLLDSKKTNDGVFHFDFKLGLQTNYMKIGVKNSSEYLSFQKDTITIPINVTEKFLKQKLEELEKQGYSLATIKLIDFQKIGSTLFATLKVDINKKRVLDEIVIRGYEKFPAGHKKNIQRLFKNKTFNKDNLARTYKAFNDFRFISQTRYPEILFTKDSTKVYLYLEKAKASRFDGYIGFANNKNNQLEFTGYLDASLVNILNTGEVFNLYWKSDNNKQVTFNAGIEIPYIFKSPLGIKASLNIFKQDSTFQNTKTAIDLGYYLTYTKKIYIGYQSTESSDIQNTKNSFISDFASDFFTASFEYSNFMDHNLFPEQTKFILKSGFGNRKSKLETNPQTFFELNLSHNLFLNNTNVLNIRSQNFYLLSRTFITSELHRFGGIQSIRGFNENSLQASTLLSILTEYRYILNRNLYVHSVLDYGISVDPIVEKRNRLLGLGFGIGIQSKNGLLNLIYANGSAKDQVIKLTNSVIQVKFITSF